jgi:hypothetical protein
MRQFLSCGVAGMLALATVGISHGGPPGGNRFRSPCEPWLRPAGPASVGRPTGGLRDVRPGPWLRPAGPASVGRVAPGSQSAADLGGRAANVPGPLLPGRFLDDDWCWTKPRIPRPGHGPSGPLSSPETMGKHSKVLQGPSAITAGRIARP